MGIRAGLLGRTVVWASLAVGVAGGCDRNGGAATPDEGASPQERPSPAAAGEPPGEGASAGGENVAEGAAEEAPSAGADPVTGALSEDAFAALHEHRGDDAPTPRGETVELADGSSAYLSLPEGDSPHPGVLVIHEWWGLNDHIRHWADRLAGSGYAALAVDLYGGDVTTESARAMELVRSVDEDAATRTLRAGHRLLTEDPRVKAPKTASIGWCFGGGWSLRAGLAIDGQDATIVYYGQPITEPERLQDLDGPLLAFFGTEDQSIPADKVAAFDHALDAAGVTHRVHRYEANHAFANPSSGRYDHAAAEKAWDEVQTFLADQLRPSG